MKKYSFSSDLLLFTAERIFGNKTMPLPQETAKKYNAENFKHRKNKNEKGKDGNFQ